MKNFKQTFGIGLALTSTLLLGGVIGDYRRSKLINDNLINSAENKTKIDGKLNGRDAIVCAIYKDDFENR